MKLKFWLTVIGPVRNGALNRLLLRPYIYHISTASLSQIAERLRRVIFYIPIYAMSHPVLEAIASGLPVVGFNSAP